MQTLLRVAIIMAEGAIIIEVRFTPAGVGNSKLPDKNRQFVIYIFLLLLKRDVI